MDRGRAKNAASQVGIPVKAVASLTEDELVRVELGSLAPLEPEGPPGLARGT